MKRSENNAFYLYGYYRRRRAAFTIRNVKYKLLNAAAALCGGFSFRRAAVPLICGIYHAAAVPLICGYMRRLFAVFGGLYAAICENAAKMPF